MLQGLGEEAEHLFDIGLLNAPDGRIWEYAIEHDSIFVTKDEDFAIRASVSRNPPAIEDGGRLLEIV